MRKFILYPEEFEELLLNGNVWLGSILEVGEFVRFVCINKAIEGVILEVIPFGSEFQYKFRAV